MPLLAWIEALITRFRCSQWADTCPKCQGWKQAARAKKAAKVERLTRPG